MTIFVIISIHGRGGIFLFEISFDYYFFSPKLLKDSIFVQNQLTKVARFSLYLSFRERELREKKIY